MSRNLLVTCLFLLLSTFGFSQKKDSSKVSIPELKIKFNQSGSHYFKTTILVQPWVRYSELNSGSKIDGFPVNNLFDIGLRRWRVQAFGQLTDKIFVYTQFGQNNFTFLQPRYTGAFLHDAVSELTLNNAFNIGVGLTSWGGYSRFSAPAVGSQMGLEPPLYQQATNGINDQFVRKMSVYAHGEIARLNYRLVLAKPMSAAVANQTPPISGNSSWSPEPPSLQTSGYFFWQFFDKESTPTPYMTGTYFGKKKLLNLGAGCQFQPNAMWHSTLSGDTVRTALLLLNADIFGELPAGNKGQMIHFYVAADHFDFGPRYYRNNNSMNPVNGQGVGEASISGPGVLYPMIGTGNILYTQVGYKLRDNLFPGQGTLMPYVTAQYAVFNALHDPAITLEGGFNWLIHGDHTGKLTVALQNRPVFNSNAAGDLVVTSRKNMIVLQYQISF